MKGISKYKVELSIIIPLILMMIISIMTINSATNILDESYSNLALKQVFWFGIGFVLAYFPKW